MKVTDTIKYVGVNDHQVDLFEGQYKVPNGMSYNSYVILDEKIAVMDTVDANFTHQWLDNIQQVLENRKPDYLIVQHMEPDHAANIANFLKAYPDTTVVATAKAFNMIDNFFELKLEGQKIEMGNGGTLSLGYHQLTFVFAPMVHWPEVMVTYDSTEKVLFSADGFGKFGALDVDEPWDDEARRYFIGIVGKYGVQVQNLLKVAATLDIQTICPLHGPVLNENLGHYIGLYDTWSSYTPEEDGIVIAYTSIYGHTKAAVSLLADELRSKGCPKVVVYDLARDDMSRALSDAFRYSKLILATTTYNASIYPFMHDYITRLVEHNFQNRTVGLIENGTWAPLAAKIMKEMLGKCKKINWLKNSVHIWSAVKSENRKQIEAMTDELCKEYIAKDNSLANKNDMSALFRIGYGLYVVTSNDGKKDNGLIVNTVTQLTDNPFRVAVNINKANYSHHVIRQTGVLNVNCRGRTILHLPAVWLPVRKNRGQICRRENQPFRKWTRISGSVYQRIYVSEGGAVCGPGHPRHVHLQRDRSPRHQRPGDHVLQLLSAERQAEAPDRRQERLCLQDLRLHLRGRRAPRGYHLPAVQARSCRL